VRSGFCYQEGGLRVARQILNSLFSGIGGFEIGFVRAGFKTALMCERDAAAQAVLRQRFPDISLASDIAELTDLPACDVLVGGWPCQDLSQAGRTAGLDGDQSGLVSHIFRLIDASRDKPNTVILENVAFSLKLQKGRAIRYVTNELEARSYRWPTVSWTRASSDCLIADVGSSSAAGVMGTLRASCSMGSTGLPGAKGSRGTLAFTGPKAIVGSAGPLMQSHH
jgi:hypothetical protein